MANGRAAMLEPQEALAREPFLAIAEIAGRAGAARIIAAAALSAADLETVARDSIETREEVSFRQGAGGAARAQKPTARRARPQRTKPAGSRRAPNPPARWPRGSPRSSRMAAGIGGCRLPRRWRNGATASPFCAAPSLTRAGPIYPTQALAKGAERLARALYRGPDEPRRDHARGSRCGAEGAAALGHAAAPRGGGADAFRNAGRIAHRARLFDRGRPDAVCPGAGALRALEAIRRWRGARSADAGTAVARARPIQITADLPGFWRGSWAAVKAEMKGRYPRHVWPDDPAKANLQELQLLRKTKPTPGGARGNKR